MSNGERNTGTFIIKILNTQNSTWQGNITWVEKQKTETFRSALEMMMMIDGAFDEKNGAKENMDTDEKSNG